MIHPSSARLLIVSHMSLEAMEAAFLSTYSPVGYADPLDLVADYNRVMVYASHHPNKGSHAIASHFDLPRGRVRSWTDSSKPDCVRGIETVKSHGWLPLSAESKVLQPLAGLVAWVFSGGSINENWVPAFTVSSSADREVVRALLNDVGLGSTDVPRDEQRADEILPGSDRSVFGRLLVALGAPRGVKNAQAKVTFPDWLNDAPRAVQAKFVEVYLRNRGQHSTESDTLTFREVRSSQYLQSLVAFLESFAGEPVRVNGCNVVVSAAAARALGFDRSSTKSDSSHL